MTLLEIMIVLAILALVMGIIVGPRVIEEFRRAKISTTKLKIVKYADEAYPSWAAAHPETACPAKLDELNAYMNKEDARDAWGQPLTMLCGSILPPAVRSGIAVVSAGPDGAKGTGDDLRSWE